MRAPIALDALHLVWSIASADGIICINMVHISPWEATLGLIKGAAAILPSASPLYLYGPYIREGFATAPTNQAFDRSLRNRDPNWGLRDVEAVAAIAQSVGFSAPLITEMPANNLSVVFPPSLIASLRGGLASERSLSKFTPCARPLSRRVTAARQRWTVCQKSAARKATTIMRRIRPRVSRTEAVSSREVSRSGSLMRNYSVARQRANLTRH